MRKRMVFLFVLGIFGGEAHQVTNHATAWLMVAVSVLFAFMLCLMVYSWMIDERNHGRGMLKTETELLEDDEIYETMGAVKLGIYDGLVVILRLRNGELRACRMGEVPPEKVFKAKKDHYSGKFDKYGYPPEALKGRIIDIQA